jgi:hypothetical protein
MNASINNRQSNEVVHFVFSIHGVSGFKSVVAAGANTRKRMVAALNNIDREISNMRKTRLPQDRKRFTPFDYNLERTFERTEKIIVNIKDVFKNATMDEEIPLVLEEYIVTMTTEEFLEKGVDAYVGNTDLFLSKLNEIESNAEKYYEARHAAKRPSGKRSTQFSDHVPQLYQCTGGFFGKDKFHVILSLDTIRSMSENGSVVEAVQQMCRTQINAVKSFRLTDYVRDVKNRDSLKEKILEGDRLFAQVEDIHVYHLARLFAERSPGSRLLADKGEEVIVKMSRMLQNESRELLQNYVMNLCAPSAVAAIDPDVPVA